MKLKISAVLAFVVFVLLFAGISGCKALAGKSGKEVPRMAIDELKDRLGDSAVTVIDVRISKDWEGSPVKIKGAIREDSNNISSWASKYGKDKTIVLYCTWPTEGTSASVARQLIDMGYGNVYALKGGWIEWEKAGYPTEPK